jgi:hypothetical protein
MTKGGTLTWYRPCIVTNFSYDGGHELKVPSINTGSEIVIYISAKAFGDAVKSLV